MASPMKKLMKKAHHSKYVLLLMRHAKAEAPEMGDDWGRGLTDKGLKQAKIMAKGLESLKLVPDYIVCSSANRTESDPDVLGAMRLGLANASIVVLASDRPFATCGLRGATALAILTPKSFA